MERKVNEFLGKFKDLNHVNFDAKETFNHEIVIKEAGYNCQYAIIQNVTFRRGIVFYNTGELGVGLKFVNCQGSHLKITGCQASGYEANFDNRSHGIILDHCDFENVVVENSYLERGMTIDKESKINRLDLRILRYKSGFFYFANSEFISLVDIHDFDSQERKETKNGEIRFHNSTIGGKFRAFNIRIQDLSITSSEITKDVFIDCCDLDAIRLNESNFGNEVKLSGNKVKYGFSVINSDFTTLDFKFFNETNNRLGALGKIYVKSCHTTRGYFIDGYSGKDIARGSLNDLEIHFDKSFDGDFHFQNLEIKNTEINGMNPSANIELSFCYLEKVTFDGVNNDGLITLKSCEATGENPEIYLLTSSLGKTRFFNFDFSRFRNIHIVDSVLIDIICVRVTWFKDDQLMTKDFERLTENGGMQSREDLSGHFGIKREICRQIKYALEKQGNRTQALDFQALELKALRKELKYKKKSSFNDKATLLFSMTNDMGVNWLRPVGWLLGSTLFFYLLFVWSLSENLEMYYPPKVIDFRASFAEYGKYLYILPQLFNPARVLERMLHVKERESLGAWLYFIDGLQRVILAFFIFQIVSAFRKYVKS